MLYKKAYKCRFCNEIIAFEDEVEARTNQEKSDLLKSAGDNASDIATHKCEEGNMGICDFIGYEKVGPQ